MTSISLAQNGTWDTTRTDMPTQKWAHSACVFDGKIYVIGGFKQTGADGLTSSFGLPGIEVYDPVADSWDTTKTPMPTARGYPATTVVNGLIYVVGGTAGAPNWNGMTKVEVYDPVTDSWDTGRMPMPTARFECKASAVNGKIYVIGGLTNDWQGLHVVEEYDPVTDNWESKTDMPTARASMATIVVNGGIYAIGGISAGGLGNGTVSKVERYNPGNDSWLITETTDMPQGRSHFGDAVLNEKIYVFDGWGGTYAQPIELTSVLMHDPITGVWLKTTEMPTTRQGTTAHQIDGKIYVIGGYNWLIDTPDGSYTKVEVYTPVSEPIYPVDTKISASYVQKDIDSLLIETEIINYQNHDHSTTAFFTSVDGAVKDSVELFDDGMHGDGLANDRIWGNYIQNISVENEFVIDIATIDPTQIDDPIHFVTPEVARFTTIGPAVVDTFAFTSSDKIANPGDNLFIKLTLRNEGVTATATNITTELTVLDTLSSISRVISPSYGDIAPQESSIMNGFYGIKINGNITSNAKTILRVDIASNGYVFWSDTFNIAIFVTSSDVHNNNAPNAFALHQNYPNPFNPRTTISYHLPVASQVELSIYNVNGQKVTTLVSEKQFAGEYKYEWDAISLPSGLYFYKLTSGDFVQTKKLLLLK
jgi:N-acetylneuraminic acid mutarotase